MAQAAVHHGHATQAEAGCEEEALVYVAGAAGPAAWKPRGFFAEEEVLLAREHGAVKTGYPGQPGTVVVLGHGAEVRCALHCVLRGTFTPHPERLAARQQPARVPNTPRVSSWVCVCAPAQRFVDALAERYQAGTPVSEPAAGLVRWWQEWCAPQSPGVAGGFGPGGLVVRDLRWQVRCSACRACMGGSGQPRWSVT